MPEQEQEEWCWAAVCAGLQGFYEERVVLACEIASTVLFSQCCPPTSACNVPMFLSTALERIGMLDRVVFGPLDWTTIVETLNQGRPIGCLIDFGTAIGHFIVLSTYDSSSAAVGVLDPAPGGPHEEPQLVPLTTLQIGYAGGRWAESYLTRRAA